MAAGHRLEDLKDGYTIDQVQLFARALAFNREQEKLDRAEAVALGISEAFTPAENLLSRLRQALINPGAIDGGRDARQTNKDRRQGRLRHWEKQCQMAISEP